MQRLGLVRVSFVLAALVSLSQCATGPSGSTGQGGSSGSTGSGGSDSSGGSTGSGGSGSGGSSASGGSTATGGSGSGGSTTGAGGSVSTGGNTGTGGAKGGTTGSGGSSGTTGSGGSSSGGTTGAGGSPTGGATGSGGSTTGSGGSGPPKDAGGVALATAPSSGSTCLSTSKQYFNLGDMRLINNRWGSDALNCGSTTQSVCITSSKTLGWMFNRQTCGGMRGDPDFPEIEFGVAPFGTGSSLLTTPNFSSTTLLPIQISAINSASLTLNNFSTSFTSSGYWDANYEFWISKNDPTKNADAGVYAEIIIFLGWEANRQNGATGAGGWACSVPASKGPVPNTNLTLCHQSDAWSQSPYWRFFNFVLNDGSDGNSLKTFSGTVDIKAILNWVMSNYANPGSMAKGNGTAAFSSSFWLTRIEVGTEIDDQTAGSAQVNAVTFEINGTSKTPQFAN
jgi:hypothetical protein